MLDELVNRLVQISQQHPLRVAIDGVDAAGKTTLADELVWPLQAQGKHVIRASIDGFHNPSAVRYRRGPDSAEGYYRDSFNYQALIDCLLKPLGPGGSLCYQTRVFDYRTDQKIESVAHVANPNSVLLFDGVFLLRPELVDYWDFSVFMSVSFSTSLARAQERDLRLFGTREEVTRRYQERYIPGQELYLDECRPVELADLVVDNNVPLHRRILVKQ
jgi:uridine kinase